MLMARSGCPRERNAQCAASAAAIVRRGRGAKVRSSWPATARPAWRPNGPALPRSARRAGAQNVTRARASSDLSFPTPRANGFFAVPLPFPRACATGMQPASSYCGPGECSPDQPIDRTPPLRGGILHENSRTTPIGLRVYAAEVVWISASTKVVRRTAATQPLDLR